MADQSKIDAIKVQLPDNVAEFGFTDEIIGSLIDSYNTSTKIILQGWQAVAAKTMSMVTVSESGSSRNLSDLNNNARQMVTYWQGLADKEDEANNTGTIQRFRSHRATRV
jgi:hypothetical protein